MDDLPIKQRGSARLQAVWGVIQANPSDKYVVVTDTKIRVRNMPP